MKFARNIAVAALLSTMFFAAAPAMAGDYCHAPQYYYKSVKVYKEVERSYQVPVVKYDHCGDAYLDYKTVYRTVVVPQWVKVKVAY